MYKSLYAINMIGFNHTAIGVIIATICPAPLVPLLAFISHFIADSLPHLGRHPNIQVFSDGSYIPAFKKLLAIDAVICFIVLFGSWLLFPDKWLIIAIGAFFSTLPDFMWLLKGKVRWLRNFFRFASWIQWGERPWGWMLEIGYFIAFVSVILLLAHQS